MANVRSMPPELVPFAGLAAMRTSSRSSIFPFRKLNRQTVQQKKGFAKSFSAVFCKIHQFLYA